VSDGNSTAVGDPSVTYVGDGWFETSLGGFGLHGDYGVVLVPVSIFEHLDLADVHQALAAANAAADLSALEWLLTDEANPRNYDDPGARDSYSLDLDHDAGQVLIRIRTARWVDEDDPERDTIRALFAPFDAHRGTKTAIGTDENENMTVEVTIPPVIGSAAMRIGDEAVALLGALTGGGITLEVGVGLVRSGMHELLIGQRESDWLDAKKQPYGLSQDPHKLELAKDVAAFANGAGGLILIGARTEEIRSGERLAEIRPIPLNLINVQQIRDVLDDWVYPVVEGLEVDAVETDSDRGIAYVYVPLQGQERRPFVVAGMERDGKVSSVFFSVPTRRDDDTHYSDVASLHGLLLAGRLAVATLNARDTRSG